MMVHGVSQEQAKRTYERGAACVASTKGAEPHAARAFV
jgi:hypothetical protein